MGFDQKQVRQLRAKLKPRHVRTRLDDGTTLHYLEGWHVIAEANRIFGFDGWDRETVEGTCVYTKHLGVRFEAVYVARVRITVIADGRSITREGSGTGEASTTSPGKAHELALKAAETDATKRALMTFGNAFGLSLYDPNNPIREQSALNGDGFAERTPPPHETAGQAAARVVSRAAKSIRQRTPPMLHADETCPSSPPVDVQSSTAPARRNGQLALEPNGTQRGDSGNGASATNSAAPGDRSAPNEAGKSIEVWEPASNSAKEGQSSATVSERRLPPSGTQDPARQDRIDKSTLTLAEPKRHRDPEHLKFVVRHGCVVCGRNRTHAHHLTFAQPNAMGRKVSDEFTVPLCPTHHQELHHTGDEEAWWKVRKLDPLAIADDLWERSRRNKVRA